MMVLVVQRRWGGSGQDVYSFVSELGLLPDGFPTLQ